MDMRSNKRMISKSVCDFAVRVTGHHASNNKTHEQPEHD